jgi:hypothetical protein
VTTPEDALALAKKRAAARGYHESGPGELERTFVDDVPDLALLAEWAVIEVDPDLVYSTRRFGGPITALKRLLLRLMRQYHGQVEARQTRFNIAVLERLRVLEQRLDSLERADRE